MRNPLFSISFLAACSNLIGCGPGPDVVVEHPDQEDNSVVRDDDGGDDDGGNDDDQDNGGNEPDPDPDPEPEEDTAVPEPEDDRFWPLEGSWFLVNVEMTLDDCNMGDRVIIDVNPAASLVVADDRSFTFNNHFGIDQCQLDVEGAPFICDTRQMRDETPRTDYGLDATILLDVRPSGEFYDEADLHVDADLTATCTGSQCGLVSLFTSSFPCEMTLTLDASAN